MKKIFLIATMLLSLAASTQHIRMSAQLKQKNDQEFGLLDSYDLIGGLMTSSDRTALPAERRVPGMIFIDTDDSRLYQLQGGILDANWTELNVSGVAEPANQLIYGTGSSASSSSNLTFDGTDLDLTGNIDMYGKLGIGGGIVAAHSIFLHDGHFGTWYSIGVGCVADQTFANMITVSGGNIKIDGGKIHFDDGASILEADEPLWHNGSDSQAWGKSIPEFVAAENENIAIGNYAFGSHNGGDFNTAIGHYALGNSVNDLNNTAIGAFAGRRSNGGGNNLVAGYYSGHDRPNSISANNLLFEQSIYLGARTTSGADDDLMVTNEIVIGYFAEGHSSNTVTLGNSDVTDVWMGSEGQANIYTETVNVDYVVSLTALSEPPLLPTLGMIYCNTDTHLYFYNGSAWVQLD